MFTTILWATDGSDDATRARDAAVELARRSGGPLHVVHVTEHFSTGRAAGLPERADEPDVRAGVERQLAQLESDGVTCVAHWAHARSGHTAQEIVTAAREAGADAIVVGSRGHSPVAELLLGSVAQQLLHQSACPVVVVPRTQAVDAAAGSAATAAAG